MRHPTRDRCALCLREANLEQSHIVPKFVFRWLKQTSATGKFRRSNAVNVRVQDGVTHRLLCRACEQRLGAWEAKFASLFFRPILDGGDVPFRVDYEEWMFMCVLSISFRAVALQMRSSTPRREHHRLLIEAVLDEWRHALLSDPCRETVSEHHVFVLSPVEEDPPGEQLPDSLNWYWMRSVDLTLAFCGDKTAFSYVKLPGMVILSGILPATIEGMDGTRVRLRGRMAAPQSILNSEIGEFVVLTRPREAMPIFEGISSSQRAVIDRAYDAARGKWESLPSFAAGHSDFLLQRRRK